MENTTEAQAILNAGAAIGENVRVLKDGSIPFTIVPDGYQVSSLEKMLAQPARKRGAVSVTDAGGFITYMNRHCEDGTLVYADIDRVSGSFKLVGVINDNSAEEPGWRDHMHDGPEAVCRMGALDWQEQVGDVASRFCLLDRRQPAPTLPLPRACRPAGTCWQCRWGSSAPAKSA